MRLPPVSLETMLSEQNVDPQNVPYSFVWTVVEQLSFENPFRKQYLDFLNNLGPRMYVNPLFEQISGEDSGAAIEAFFRLGKSRIFAQKLIGLTREDPDLAYRTFMNVEPDMPFTRELCYGLMYADVAGSVESAIYGYGPDRFNPSLLVDLLGKSSTEGDLSASERAYSILFSWGSYDRAIRSIVGGLSDPISSDLCHDLLLDIGPSRVASQYLVHALKDSRCVESAKCIILNYGPKFTARHLAMAIDHPLKKDVIFEVFKSFGPDHYVISALDRASKFEGKGPLVAQIKHLYGIAA